MSTTRTTDTRIFIATHAKRPYPEVGGYISLQVGAALASDRFAMISDDQGDNISKLNPTFNEMTGLYWIWKNDSSHIVGLAHHRRYFAPKARPGFSFEGIEIAHPEDFEDLHRGVDMIVATPRRWLAHADIPLSTLNAYALMHVGPDMFLARQEVIARTPDYRDAFDYVLASNQISHYNMFVARKAVIDEYCEWVFPVLFSLEKLIPYEFYEHYQSRVIGFLAERLFNVWLCQNRGRFRIITREIARTEEHIF